MSGQIQNVYRELEAKVEAKLILAKQYDDFKNIKLQSIYSGNIWSNVRVLEQNVETLNTFLESKNQSSPSPW